MSIRGYLAGVAPFAVADLLPGSRMEIDLLLVLESPHIDELGTGVPLSGKAGQDAFNYLFPNAANSTPLGPFIAGLHANGDCRIAVVNASTVPLQKAAYKKRQLIPPLSQHEWDLLEKTRINRANEISGIQRVAVAETNREILDTLQQRVDTIRIKKNALIVPAGRFAQRTWRSISIPSSWPRHRLLPVLHPANDWWSRTTNQGEISQLKMLRDAFEEFTT